MRVTSLASVGSRWDDCFLQERKNYPIAIDIFMRPAATTALLIDQSIKATCYNMEYSASPTKFFLAM
jgi:hypothetical protein